jgi:hypothetical protein
MKVVHINKAGSAGGERPFLVWFREARALEKEHPEQALAEYEKIRKAYPLREAVYDRLMIFYHKQKAYDREKKLIETAIHTFQRHYGTAGRHPGGRKVASLSRSLSQSLGLTDKQGRLHYDAEPFARWNKRKATLEKKTGRQKTARPGKQ